MRLFLFSTVLAGLGAALAACGSSAAEPLVEYPPMGTPDESDGGPSTPREKSVQDAGTADVVVPTGGTKILDGFIFLRSATSDGHLVFDQGLDLAVLPDGTNTPVIVVKDFDVGYDSLQIKQRFVAAWLGEDPGPKPPALWSKAGGLQAAAVPLVHRDAIYPKPASEDFVYLTSGTSSLKRDVWATKVGGGVGLKVIADVDTGVVSAQCRPQLAYIGSDILFAGCVANAPLNVALYAADGSGKKTILDNAAPGSILNRARTHIIVQTQAASSIRPLSGVGAPVALDGPIAQAVFTPDDSKVVYVMPDGKVKRASATAPASPTEIATGMTAKVLYAISADARFAVIATKGDTSKPETDLLVLDATSPGAPTTLAAEKASFLGVSQDGKAIVYLAEKGLGLDGKLYVMPFGGTPQKLSDDAERVETNGDVIYFQEFDKDKKSNVLRATHFASPTNVIKIDEGLDTLTARELIVGKNVYVGSKLGLWRYPLLP